MQSTTKNVHWLVIASTLALILTLPAAVLAQTGAAAKADAAGSDDAKTVATDSQGYIYGRVTTESGKTYQGRLRWNGDEEAFWGDLFNGTKDDLPHTDDIPSNERNDRDTVSVFGIKFSFRGDWSHERSFATRFGDIRKIEMTHRGEVRLTMKDSAIIELDGGSNDIGADVYVWDEESGKKELDWDDLQQVELMPAPADLPVEVRRLYGKVTARDGTFEGFIEWDKDERYADEELDGEDRKGNDREIPMGDIRSIARRSHSSSTVVLKNGSEVVLDGTNDVNHENRGIVVEDPRYGLVTVKWDSFERLDFMDPGSVGPSYADFNDGGPITGKVTARGGKSYEGEIVYDVDESRRWEILDGEDADYLYKVPFALIRSIEPRGEDCRVTLRGGEKLRLSDTADVGGDNAGIIVLNKAKKATFVAWDDVEKIEFSDPGGQH